MDKPHQRIGSLSNAHVGAEFERVARAYFAAEGVHLIPNFEVEIGLSRKKRHCFDLGSAAPQMLVECKSHTWTTGGRVPSAKMTVWNEAMYYFHLASDSCRKVLFVLHDRRQEEGEGLLTYYRRTHYHLIPDGIEFLEWDAGSKGIIRV